MPPNSATINVTGLPPRTQRPTFSEVLEELADFAARLSEAHEDEVADLTREVAKLRTEPRPSLLTQVTFDSQKVQRLRSRSATDEPLPNELPEEESDDNLGQVGVPFSEADSHDAEREIIETGGNDATMVGPPEAPPPMLPRGSEGATNGQACQDDVSSLYAEPSVQQATTPPSPERSASAGAARSASADGAMAWSAQAAPSQAGAPEAMTEHEEPASPCESPPSSPAKKVQVESIFGKKLISAISGKSAVRHESTTSVDKHASFKEDGALEEVQVIAADTPSNKTQSDGQGVLQSQLSVTSKWSKAGRLANRIQMMTANLESKAKETTPQATFLLRDIWQSVNDDKILMVKARHMSQHDLGTNNSCEDLDQHMHSLESNWYVLETYCNCKSVIHPQSRRRLFWDLLAFIFLAWDFVMVPMEAFGLPDSAFFITVDYMIVLFWTFDMGWSFLTGVYVGGELVMHPPRIVRNYLRTWFAFDLLVVLPEWLALIFSSVGSQEASASSLIRFLRGGRFLRFLRYLKMLRLIKLQRVIQDFKARSNNGNVLLLISILRLLLGILGLVHMLACLWYMAGDNEGGWVETEGIGNATLPERYFRSFEWSLARLHPTQMSNNMELVSFPERLLAIGATMVAMIIGSIFISSVTNTMAEHRRYRQDRNNKLSAVRDFVRDHSSASISQELTVRMKKYIEAEGSGRKIKGESTDRLMHVLPVECLKDLFYEVWSPVICKHTFFDMMRDKHQRILRNITFKSLEAFASLCEPVFNKGDICSQMYFIVKGLFSYNQNPQAAKTTKGSAKKDLKEAVLARKASGLAGRLSHLALPNGADAVSPGQWLSEPVLWTNWEHHGTLVCQDRDGVMLNITAEAFVEILREHERALIDAAIYARCFIVELNQKEDSARSDLITVGADNENDADEEEKPIEPVPSFRDILGRRPSLRDGIKAMNRKDLTKKDDAFTSVLAWD